MFVKRKEFDSTVCSVPEVCSEDQHLFRKGDLFLRSQLIEKRGSDLTRPVAPLSVIRKFLIPRGDHLNLSTKNLTPNMHSENGCLMLYSDPTVEKSSEVF